MKQIARAALLFGISFFGVMGQEAPPLRVTVRLVQIDAVVQDKAGHHIADLKREELRLLQDGKERKITHFSYIGVTPAGSSHERNGRQQPERVYTPAAPMTVRDIRRTVALVVDDLGLSWESMHRVKGGLREFVDRHLQADDAVAIVRTGSGTGTLQQFTTDRQMLYAAIDRLHWTGLSRAGVDSVKPMNEDELAQVGNGRAQSISMQTFERFRSRSYTLGTLGALNRVVEELGKKPGRKSAVLFSDGLQIFSGQDDRITGGPVSDRLRRLCEQANRAGVSFYTVDTRGPIVLAMRAVDTVRSGPAAAQLSIGRHKEYTENQEGMAMLARETGGVFSGGRNDLALAAANALGDQSGYYLIGYDPGPGVFDDEQAVTKFHRIKILVKRAGAKVRTRPGFYGVADRPAPPPKTDRQSQLLAAIRDPFQSGDIGLRLSAIYAITEQTGPAILAMLHIDGAKLDFHEVPGSELQAAVDVALISFGEEGHAEASTADTYQIRVKPEQLEEARQRGFVYKVTHKLERPGAYQVRVAVRDATTGQVDSASQFVELPDWRQKRLAVSGVLLTADGGGNTASVLRQFGPKTKMSYSIEVYNAGPETAILSRLYRDGRLVWTGQEHSIPGAERVPLSRDLTFDNGAAAGNYVLEVRAVRREGGKIREAASQWTDFEILGDGGR